MKWHPADYAKRALSYMMRMGEVGLLLDPGMGKTSIAATAFQILKDKGVVRTALVVVPIRPMYTTWPREIKKWDHISGLTYSILHDKGKEAALKKKVDIYLINPEGLKWLVSQRNLPEFDVIIVDESTKFKDSQTKRFKLLKSLLPGSSRRWILTGTPVPNGLQDLFGQIYILDYGKTLGRFITHFRMRYLYQNPKTGDWEPRPGAFEEVAAAVDPFCIRLKAEDHLQMPKLIQTDIEVILPPTVRKIYDTVQKEFYAMVDNFEIVAKNKASAGGKLRQVANGAVYVEEHKYEILHDEKIEAVRDLLEQLNGNPVILVYEFIHDRDRLKRAFPQAQIMTGLSPKDLVKAEQLFNDGKLPILLIHAGSAAGLNLQSVCHHVIWFSLTWNLEHYIQTNDRVYRQGQSSGTVHIYHVVALQTKDQRVAQALREKDIDQQRLLDLITVKE